MELRGKLKNISWKTESKRLGIAFGLALIFTLAFCLGQSYSYANTIQGGIADKVVRFHVLANSDAAEDQRVKLLVRDALLAELTPELEEITDLQETKKFLQENFPRIQEVAARTLAEEGYDYGVKVSLTRDYFPVKTYGDITFPPGYYDALRVELGESSGQNWWCVVYPPMCFVDATYADSSTEGERRLAGKLTSEEFRVVSAKKSNKVMPKVKLKTVELWQNRKGA